MDAVFTDDPITGRTVEVRLKSTSAADEILFSKIKQCFEEWEEVDFTIIVGSEERGVCTWSHCRPIPLEGEE